MSGTRNSGSSSRCFLYQTFVKSIDNMMKGVIKNTPLETSKKELTNQAARKTVVKKLRAVSVERQSIIQMTGHASEKSPYLPIWSFPPTTSTSEQGNTSVHAFTVNNFHICQVKFNVVQGQCSSPKACKSLRPIEIKELKTDLRTFAAFNN